MVEASLTKITKRSCTIPGKPYHSRPYPIQQDTQSYSNERDKQTSINRGHKEVIIIVMSLSDIYNPREQYDSMELADLQGTQLEFVNPKSTPHCRS
jgi:hypothetical protein